MEEGFTLAEEGAVSEERLGLWLSRQQREGINLAARGGSRGLVKGTDTHI